ncbi:MAG: S8 family serine peptidase [Chitinophagales bacterium]
MKKTAFLIVLFSTVLFSDFLIYAQTYRYTRYWVELKDKKGTPYSIEDANSFLSQKALIRRGKAGIPIDSSDLPVNPAYIQQVAQLGIEVLGSSKWLNSLIVEINDSTQLSALSNESFVTDIKPVYRIEEEDIPRPVAVREKKSLVFAHNTYGAADAQMELVNGKYLHDKSYTGKGKTIAVLDAGFSGTPEISAFSDLYADNRVSKGGDLVKNSPDIYAKSTHGTLVLSVMGGKIDSQFTGAAPDANYVLFRTENTDSEYPIEEHFWILAAEKADSMGVDIINSSLGYSTFQDTTLNYSYSDMDGQTTAITRGATMAAKKGILVVTSAGNSGSSDWYYITAPADADGVLTVGAVNTAGDLAPFSSRGPSYDGRIKPDVVGVGWNTALIDQNGDVRKGNGTSFSAPHISGMAACLWQAAPDLSSAEMLEVIRQSSDRYHNPDNDYGYGIPNFGKAYLLALNEGGNGNIKALEANVFPNPFTDHLNLLMKVEEAETVKVQLVDYIGRIVFENDWQLEAGVYSEMRMNGIQTLHRGVYFVRIQREDSWEVVKVLKL